MQLKKLVMPLVVIMLMGMTSTAFAQLNCSVSSTPVSRATQTGHTELAGDVIFTCAESDTDTTSATITFDFGAPITNSDDYPDDAPIEILPGLAAGDDCFDAATIQNINHETGQVVIAVPACATTGAESSSFNLTNVLVSLPDVGADELVVEVSVSPGDNISIVAGQDEATVISSIRVGLEEIEADEEAQWLATGIPVTADVAGFAVTATEEFIDLFHSEDQVYDGDSNSNFVLFEFSGIPDGAEIECEAFIEGGDYGFAGDNVMQLAVGNAIDELEDAVVLTADDNVAFVGFPDPVDLNEQETVTLTCGHEFEFDTEEELGILTFSGGGFAVEDAELPLTGVITVRATLAPTGDALDDDEIFDDPTDGGEIPRYEEDFTEEVDVLSFTPATTTFIVPLAMGTPVTPAPFGSYDTGIAIANTTSDPFDDDDGGAFGQDGTATFYFFPTTGDPFTVTPAQLAGSCGTNSDGEIVTGRTFLCNVSEILREGARTTAFTGYIFVVANFTNGHGTAFIYGGTPQERFTSATNMLVIAPTAVVARIANPEVTYH